MSDKATLRPVAKQIRLDTEGMRAGATVGEASSERVSSTLRRPSRSAPWTSRKREKADLTEVVSAPEVGWVGNLALFLLVERGLSQAGNVAFKT